MKFYQNFQFLAGIYFPHLAIMTRKPLMWALNSGVYLPLEKNVIIYLKILHK